MRGGCLFVVLAACSSPTREGVPVDAPPSTSDAPDAPDAEVRPITGVLVWSYGVMWTYGTEACSLEFGCWYGGPTLSLREAQTGITSVLDDSGAGAMAVVGDEHDAFYVTGTTHEQRYVKRLSGGALSIPRPWTQGLAIDDTYVYWADQPTNAGTFTVRRAMRTGDGSDAIALATVPYVKRLVVYAGYVWLRGESGTLTRVPTAGGAPEEIASGIGAMTVSPDGLVVGRGGVTGNQPWAELGIFDATAAYRSVVQLPSLDPVRHLAADDRDIYLSTGSAHTFTIQRVPVAGGPLETVATDMAHGDAIAITADKLLYDFTPKGFKSIAR